MEDARQPSKYQLTQIIDSLGQITKFLLQFFKWVRARPYRYSLYIQEMSKIGVGSAPIIILVGFFTGAVFALQTGYAFRLFNAESMVGSTVALSLCREIGPVFAALMVIAHMGSAMAAEIGTMRVSEQIDALETMAVNPYHYLVVPKILSTTLMLPLLTVLFNFVGIYASYLVGVGLLDIPEGPFLIRLEQYVEIDDLYGGLFKSVLFGFLLSGISCYQGFYARGGAAGVGRATTKAVVQSSVSILIIDYFLTQWILEFIVD